MHIKQMKFILQIAEDGSFTKAAKKLNISQPYLSQYISKVEQQMGVHLFDRTMTPIQLTHIGELICDKAKKMIKINEDMSLELDYFKGIRSRKIDIGVSQASASLIPKIFPAFYKKFPNIEIKINECRVVKEMESLILNGQLDIGIFPLFETEDNLDYQVIEEKRMLLALPSKHPIAKKIKKSSDEQHPFISLELLKDEEFILPEKKQQTHLLLDKPFLDAGFEPKVLCTTQTMDVANAIVASGMGICFTLPEMIRDDYKDKISLFQIDKKHTLRPIVLAYRKEKYLPDIVKEFVYIAKRRLNKKK